MVNNALALVFTRKYRGAGVSNNVRLDNISNKFHYLTTLDFIFRRTETIKSKDTGFVHLLKLRHFNNCAYLAEVFAQWQLDKFILLQNRFLLGTGLRFDLSRLLTEGHNENKACKIYAGIGLICKNARNI